MTNMPRVWLMRGGGHGEDEEAALAEGRAIIGFRDAGDLSSFADLNAIAAALVRTDKERNEARAMNWARQLWAFSRGAREGDAAVMPLKTRPGQIALGRVAGPYEYAFVGGEQRHTRKVTWLKPDVPRLRISRHRGRVFQRIADGISD
jgi:restriction system protein